MKAFAPAVQANLMKSAVAAGEETVRAESIALAPYFHGNVSQGHPPPGTLKKAIQRKFMGHAGTRTTWVIFVRTGKAARFRKVRVAEVGPMSPGQRRRVLSTFENQDAFYWKWVNFGTGRTKKPIRFMERGLTNKANQAIEALGVSLRNGIARMDMKNLRRKVLSEQ